MPFVIRAKGELVPRGQTIRLPKVGDYGLGPEIVVRSGQHYHRPLWRPVRTRPEFHDLTILERQWGMMIDEADAQIRLTAEALAGHHFDALEAALNDCVAGILAEGGWRAAYAFVRGLYSLHSTDLWLEVTWWNSFACDLWAHAIEAAWEKTIGKGRPAARAKHFWLNMKTVNDRLIEDPRPIGRG